MEFQPQFPFSLRQLQYAVAVADLLSFHKAAERCHVSQPSLSAQIAQLEGGIGFQLFERDRRRVFVTPAGGAFLQRARRILREAGDLHDSLRRAADPFAGTLRLGIIPTIAPYLLPEVVPALRARYPKLSFHWTEDKTATLNRSLESGELDGAILALEAPLGHFTQLVLGIDKFVLALGPNHRLARVRRAATPQELEGERFLLLDDGHCFREQALAVCSSAGAEEEDYRATSLATLVQMVAGGDGATLLPSLALQVENRRGSLQIRELAPKAPHRTLALVWRRSSARETALEGVGETLRESYRAIRRVRPREGAG